MPTLKILIVDDDPICLRALTSLLETHYSCEIKTAETATDALTILNNMSLDYDNVGFDLMFMDIHLPDIHGDVLTKIIRKTQEQEKNTPIIAITAYAEQSKEKNLATLGITDLIIKPITLTLLNETIQKYIG